jgi:hypothetical protein
MRGAIWAIFIFEQRRAYISVPARLTSLIQLALRRITMALTQEYGGERTTPDLKDKAATRRQIRRQLARRKAPPARWRTCRQGSEQGRGARMADEIGKTKT